MGRGQTSATTKRVERSNLRMPLSYPDIVEDTTPGIHRESMSRTARTRWPSLLDAHHMSGASTKLDGAYPRFQFSSYIEFSSDITCIICVENLMS